MAAFVPGAGLPLSSSRVFVSGSDSSLKTVTKHHERTIHPTDISAFKLPKISIPTPSLPSLPKLGKKTPPAPKPPTPSKPVATKLQVGGRSVAPKQKSGAKLTPESTLAKGIPKFYNPKTSRAEYRATAKGQNATAFDIRVGREKNTTNRRVNEQGTFRNMDPYTEELVWARPGWSSDEARVGVRTALRNVLGNANLFESEIAELATSISCVTETANMKEFVRAVGLSEAYRSRFFESTSNTRFIELNFLHFLGRAPYNQEEVSEHIKIITEEGYNAEINSYIDSDEYDTLWGETRIPAVNFKGGHPYNNDMNKIAVLNGSFSSTDRPYKKAFLLTGDSANLQPYGIFKGLPEAWRGENAARNEAGPVNEYSPDIFWNPQPPGLREAELAWTARYGVLNKFWYKDSIVYKQIMTPKMTETAEEVEEAQAILKYGSTMAKNYIGVRKTFDIAPVISIRPPTSTGVMNGQLSIEMKEISFAIPSDLQQKE